MLRAALIFAITASAVFAAAPKPPALPKKPVRKPPATPAPQKIDAREIGIEPLLKRAVASMQKGALTSAKDDLEAILKIAPEHPIALLDLGIIAYRQKNFSEAETILQRAIKSDPGAAQAWTILGIARHDDGRLDAALAALAQAVFLDPKNARAHHYLGVTIGKKGWYSGAEDEMRKAIELDPDYAEAHYNLAVFYLHRQPPAVELARRHYQKALDLGAAPDAEVARKIGD